MLKESIVFLTVQLVNEKGEGKSFKLPRRIVFNLLLGLLLFNKEIFLAILL